MMRILSRLLFSVFTLSLAAACVAREDAEFETGAGAAAETAAGAGDGERYMASAGGFGAGHLAELTVAAQAIELLSLAPTGEIADRDTMPAETFLRNANDLLPAAGLPVVITLEDAVEGLERLVQVLGPVVATVESDPPGLRVFYRRVYRPVGRNPREVTTNDSVILDPAGEYYFWTTNPAGERVQQRKDCRHGCRASFVFTERASPSSDRDDKRVIYPGEERRGTLTADKAVDSWRLFVADSSTTYVDVESSDFDPVVLVQGPTRAPLADDDSGCDLGARVSIRVTSRTEFWILVSSFRRGSSGRYILRVEEEAPSC